MPVLTWIAIGVGGSFALATAVALGVARVPGVIARDVSGLYAGDDWAEIPVSREVAPDEGRVEKGRRSLGPEFGAL
jgi:hypothetical protein